MHGGWCKATWGHLGLTSVALDIESHETADSKISMAESHLAFFFERTLWYYHGIYNLKGQVLPAAL